MPLKLYRLYNQHLIIRLASTLTAAVLVLVIGLQIFTRIYYRQAMLGTAATLQEQNLATMQNVVSTRLRDYNDILYKIAIDKTLRQNLLQYEQSGLNDEYALMYNTLHGQLREYANYRSDIIAVTLVSAAGSSVIYNRGTEDISRNFWLLQPESYLPGLCEQARHEPRVFLAPATGQIYGRPAYHAVLGLWDLYSHEPIGTVVMTLDAIPLCENLNNQVEQTLLGVWSNQTPNSNTYTRTLLVLPEGQIIASPDQTELGQIYATPADMLVKETILNQQGARLISLLDRRQLLAPVERFQQKLLIFMFAVLVIYMVLLLFMLRKITLSLHRLRTGIEEVRHGSLDTQISVYTHDELAQIAETFNAMVNRLQATTAEREAQTLARIRAINLRRIAEIQTLESQINSHFLYNTLNVINYTALEKDTEKVSLQIRQLAGCLRYTFDKSRRIVPLSQEITWLEQYLFLQKQRYERLFDYQIHVANSIREWPIRKLLIQPFVENAIMHGFAGRTHGGLLSIRFRLFKEDRLWITIRDNGQGISAEKLRQIRQLFASQDLPEEMGIGLENAWFRIRTYYRGEGRIYVSSMPGKETCFHILLPRLQDDHDGHWWQPRTDD